MYLNCDFERADMAKIRKNTSFCMKYRYLISFGFLFCALLSFSSIYDSYGHGLGSEVLPPELIGSKMVTLEVSSNLVPDTDTREIYFSLYETDTGITVKDVTYSIIAEKENELLFDETFQSDDGIVVLKLTPTESQQILVEEQGANFFGSVFGPNKTVVVKGNAFATGGLYNFKIIITTVESYSNVITPPLDYDVGISIPDKTYHDISDVNFGQQQLGVITYYSQIENFDYDAKNRTVSFSMPFDWSAKNIEQTLVVHQELIIPKTFGDLMVESILVNINGVQMPENLVTIDDFSNKNRVVHFVMGKNDLLNISKESENTNDKIMFGFSPAQSDLPLSNVTENGQYRINLSWEPQNIQSGSLTTFMVDVTDVFLLDRPVLVNYDLSIIYGDKTVFQKNSTSTGLKTELDMIEFLVPDDVTGPIILQFENLDGNDLADTILSVVVNRTSVDEISIPDWIKNNAGWWATDQIDDSAFVQGIQYLIKENVIVIPHTEASESLASQQVPAWIKNNAGWWATDQIDDSAFVQGIQYLIKNGIMVV
tara:strand:+ start:482 stop:2101 length:1620 start_codon:yes stop_codon:yes gene_type:complete